MLNINDVREDYIDRLIKIDLSITSLRIINVLKSKFGTSCTTNYFKEGSESRSYVNTMCSSTDCATCRANVIQFTKDNYIKKTNNLSNWR